MHNPLFFQQFSLEEKKKSHSNFSTIFMSDWEQGVLGSAHSVLVITELCFDWADKVRTVGIWVLDPPVELEQGPPLKVSTLKTHHSASLRGSGLGQSALVVLDCDDAREELWLVADNTSSVLYICLSK